MGLVKETLKLFKMSGLLRIDGKWNTAGSRRFPMDWLFLHVCGSPQMVDAHHASRIK
jgi:hypothetical protein